MNDPVIAISNATVSEAIVGLSVMNGISVIHLHVLECMRSGDYGRFVFDGSLDAVDMLEQYARTIRHGIAKQALDSPPAVE